MYKGFVSPEGNIVDIGDVSHLFWWKTHFPDLAFLAGGWIRWRIHPEDLLIEIEYISVQHFKSDDYRHVAHTKDPFFS